MKYVDFKISKTAVTVSAKKTIAISYQQLRNESDVTYKPLTYKLPSDLS